MHLIARVNRGGTATWLNGLIWGMRQKGIQTLLVAGYVPDNESEDNCFKELNGIRIENLGRNLSLLSDFKAFFEIRRIIKTNVPDILNTHTAKAGVLGRLAAYSLLKKRPKIVHTFHGHLLYGYFNKITTSIIKIIEKLLALITDRILVSGERVRNELVANGVGNLQKYRVIRPGVKEISKLDKFDSKNHFGLPANILTIGWMGRLTKIKRPDRFVELAKNFPHQEFLIAGEGELLEPLKMNSPKNLKFVGWQKPDLFWSTCDIAVLTSENEAQPLALVEAAQLGIPAVAENVGSVSEVVEDRISGILVGDDKSRLIALQELIENAEKRRTLGNAAIDIAKNRFGIEQFVNSHIKAYEELI